MNQPVPDPRTTWEEEGAGGTEGYIAIHQYLWNKPGNGSQSRRKWNRVLKHPAELVHVWGWVSHSDSEATAKPKGQRTLSSHRLPRPGTLPLRRLTQRQEQPGLLARGVEALGRA